MLKSTLITFPAVVLILVATFMGCDTSQNTSPEVFYENPFSDEALLIAKQHNELLDVVLADLESQAASHMTAKTSMTIEGILGHIESTILETAPAAAMGRERAREAMRQGFDVARQRQRATETNTHTPGQCGFLLQDQPLSTGLRHLVDEICSRTYLGMEDAEKLQEALSEIRSQELIKLSSEEVQVLNIALYMSEYSSTYWRENSERWFEVIGNLLGEKGMSKYCGSIAAVKPENETVAPKSMDPCQDCCETANETFVDMGSSDVAGAVGGCVGAVWLGGPVGCGSAGIVTGLSSSIGAGLFGIGRLLFIGCYADNNCPPCEGSGGEGDEKDNSVQ